MKICSRVISMEQKLGGFEVQTNNAVIRIVFLNSEVVRIRVSFDGEFDEASYALSTVAWEDRLDSLFEKERRHIESFMPEVEETDVDIKFITPVVKLILNKDPIGFEFYDSEDDLLYSDVMGNPFVLDSNKRVNHYSKISKDNCFYGFGEQPGDFNKAQKLLRLSAKDCMGYDSVTTDGLYKHIPFYIKLLRENSKAIGLFYNNTYECSFNMGREKSNYWPYYSVYQADGGDIDLYLIGGTTIKNILDNYTWLTGRPAMLPKRALGYQGSSMYYSELEKDSDDAINEFVDTVKEEGYPIDGFHLSSGYTSQNNKRCVFTWNTERFKEPRKYFAQMNEKGAQNVPNVKPGILTCHPWYDEMKNLGVFVKDSEEEKPAIGKWWGGDGSFWDFTIPKAREQWKKYLTENVIDIGTNSIWNDNCEYDSLLDKDARVNYDGKGGTIGQLKPIMSNMMCKLATEAIIEHDADARPYIVCRSGYAGIQKYAQTWCGDNFTSWKTLKYNIATILGMGLSGAPNQGADIGGFYGTAPDEELFVRWVQNGIFQPRFSIHSTNTDNTVTEPWMYTGVKDIILNTIKLRYHLAPYFYSLMQNATKTGEPIMRPLVYEFQNDPNCADEGIEFMFGPDLLVANVVEEGATNREVYLPAGSRWFDYNDKFKVYEGGQKIVIPVELSTIPMFVREGAIIPFAVNELKSMEKDATLELKLIMAPYIDNSFTVYDDDGHTNKYKDGVFKATTFDVERLEEIVNINVSSEGSYKDTVEKMYLDLICKEKSPFWVSIDGNKINHFLNRRKFSEADCGWYYSQSKKSVEIKYPNPKKDYTVTVSFEEFDLVGM